MSSTGRELSSARHELPSGYRPVALPLSEHEAPLRLCVLMREQPEPAAGRLVVLRDMVDARAFLGCVVDAADAVHQWLAIWVQDTTLLAKRVPEYRQIITNGALDERWRRTFDGLLAGDPEQLMQTGWETTHPAPMLIDPAEARLRPAIDAATDLPWQLCTDEAFLQARQLPSYAGSPHRYLYLPGAGEQSPIMPLAEDAPRGEGAVTPEQAIEGYADAVKLNVGGGLMLVQKLCGPNLEEWADYLGGGARPSVDHGRTKLDLAGLSAVEEQTDAMGEGRLFMGLHGRQGQIIETLHLKLRLLADAISSVATMVTRTRRPMLNLTPGSFQVAVGKPGEGLPTLWTARAQLVHGGAAVRVPIGDGETHCFVQGEAPEQTIYDPTARPPVRGRCSLRIREVLKDDEQMVLEGTLASDEAMEPARGEMVWLTLNLAAGRVDLYGRIESDRALAAGEWRLRTVGQGFAEEVRESLRASEGVLQRDVPFVTIPLLSTPSDLYALAVIAMRLLLVDERTTLAVVLDEVLSLARQLGEEGDASSPLGLRIRALMDADERWMESLSPQRIVQAEMTAAEAFDMVPPELWCDTLAMIVRMLPGMGEDSICRDFGDALPDAPQRVFEQPLEEARNLLLRTRSLIVIDWRYNREVHSVIREAMAHIGAS